MARFQTGTKCCPKIYVLVTNLVIMLGMIFVLIETVDQLTVPLVMEPRQLIRQINC